MLAAFIRVEVGTDIYDASGESCQRLLVDTLAGTPVHLGQQAITGCDNGMLAAFSRDVVASDADDRTVEAGQDVLMDTLDGTPVHLGQRAITGCDDGLLAAFIRVEVGADVDDASREGCQRLLVDALVRAPVHLGQCTGAQPDNDVLRPFRGDIIARGTSRSAIAAELRQNILCNFGEGSRIRCSRTAADLNGQADGWRELCDIDLTILLGHAVVARNIDRNGKGL